MQWNRPSPVNMMESQWKLRQQHDQNWESHCKTNTSVRRKKKSKTARLWEWQSGIWVGKLTIWVRSYEIMTEFTRSISFTRIDKRHKSKDKHICRWVDQGNLIYVRWNRIKNHAQRWRRWLMEEKEVRHWV